MYKRNIVLEYFHTFTRNFSLTHVIWMLYLAARGFSLVQIGIYEGIFHLTSLTMEIPTGAVADIYGRKTSRLLGAALYTVYLLILAYSLDPIIVGVGFVLCGLSYTLESGAGDALVYDSLLEEKNEDQFKKVNRNKEILYQLGSTAAALVGGYIASISHSLVFDISLVIMILSFFILAFMKETTIDKPHDGIKKQFREQYVESFKYVFNNKKLILYILIGNLMSFPVTVLFFYSQNYYTALGYDEFQIGMVLALGGLMAAAGAIAAVKVDINDKYIFSIIPIIIIGLLWGYMTPYTWIALALLSAFESIMYITIMDHVNRNIPSDKRATILSISSMVFSILMILVFPLVGWLAQTYSFEVGFIFNACIVMIGYVIYLVRFKQVNAE